MASKRVACPVRHNFVCNTCGATQDFLRQGKEAEVFFQSQTARKLLCHPLPLVYRSQEAERTSMLEEKGSRLTGPKVSSPLAVRTFDIDDFAFGAVSTTFTLAVPPPPALPRSFSLSSSPESANSGTGSLLESNMVEEAREAVRFFSNNRRRGKSSLHKIDGPNISCADVAFGFESVEKGEIISLRQTRNRLKKQTSSDTVFKASSGAHRNKSTRNFAKADSVELGGAMLVDCQSQLSSPHDMDEDMTRILNQLKANFRLEGGGV
jgi:hypothetical protein